MNLLWLDTRCRLSTSRGNILGKIVPKLSTAWCSFRTPQFTTWNKGLILSQKWNRAWKDFGSTIKFFRSLLEKLAANFYKNDIIRIASDGRYPTQLPNPQETSSKRPLARWSPSRLQFNCPRLAAAFGAFGAVSTELSKRTRAALVGLKNIQKCGPQSSDNAMGAWWIYIFS